MLRGRLIVAVLIAALSPAQPTAVATDLDELIATADRAARPVMADVQFVSNVKSYARVVRPMREYRKTSGFRERQRRHHTGVDLAASRGTAIFAVMSGRVIFAGWDGAYGRKIVINHGAGRQTVYAHLDSMSVKKGQKVRAGKRIGRVGTSGRTTGPHLHFEFKKNGAFQDPARWLKSLGVRL